MVSSKVWTRTASAAAALLLTAAAPGAALAAGGNGNGNANGADNGNGNGGSNAKANGGTGHTPVTVCHRLGNGGYHVLTMDDSALKACQGSSSTCFTLTRWLTALGERSNTTHSCPFFSSRRTMFAPFGRVQSFRVALLLLPFLIDVAARSLSVGCLKDTLNGFVQRGVELSGGLLSR